MKARDDAATAAVALLQGPASETPLALGQPAVNGLVPGTAALVPYRGDAGTDFQSPALEQCGLSATVLATLR